MVRQLGIFPMSGTIDNITFFQTADGKFSARKKSSLTAAEIAAKPGFDRLRKHNQEFIRASKAMGVLRSSITELLVKTADRKAAQRLQRKLLDCTRADSTSIFGERSPQNGDLSILQHFNFNSAAPLNTIMAAPYTASIDRLTGAFDLNVPAFNPLVSFSLPPNATHYKFLMGAAGVDFVTKEVENDATESAYFPLTNALTTALSLGTSLTANSTKHLFLLLGIRFYEEINSIKEPIYSHNPLTIVALDQ